MTLALEYGPADAIILY